MASSLISAKELSFCQRGHWIIGHLPAQGPSCPVAQFDWMASSRNSMGSAIFFSFPNVGAHCAIGKFQHSRHCFIPFPRFIPPHNSISEFYRQFLGVHGGVSALTCTVSSGTLYRKVCFFLNNVQPIELATDGLQ